MATTVAPNPTPDLGTVPGTRIQVDSRISGDVTWLLSKFHLRLTAGYAPTGHISDGDHPKGLAVDLVPDFANGGTWQDAADAAAYAKAHPTIFRWIGYNGEPGHGDPQHTSTPHLHLSWHGGGTAGDTAPLRTISDSKLAGDSSGSVAGVAGVLLSSPLGSVVGPLTAPITSAAADTAQDVAKAAVGQVWDAVGKDGLRALLYGLLVIGGSALAVVGIVRASGIGQRAERVAVGATEAGLAAKSGNVSGAAGALGGM